MGPVGPVMVGQVGPVIGQQKKEKSPAIVENPHYGEVEEDVDGNAIIPCDFLPAMVEKLPDGWFYRTYRGSSILTSHRGTGMATLFRYPI